MHLLKFGLLTVCGIACVTAVYAGPQALPGGIQLLPGYKHEKLKGIDTRVGKIWKDGGLSFSYDIGKGAGNQAKGQDKKNVLWFKEQVVAGHAVQLALTKDQTLYVSFPQTHANFYGQVKTSADLADLLLMVLTYAPAAGPK